MGQYFHPTGNPHLVDNYVFGCKAEWEKHEVGDGCAFVRQLDAADAAMKAQIAARFHELGFVPMFFKEHGQEFVALEDITTRASYADIEQAFVAQILAKAK